VKDERDLVDIFVCAISSHSREQGRHGLGGHPGGLEPVALVTHVVDVTVSTIEVAATGNFEKIGIDRYPRRVDRALRIGNL
jgi:hypothetical protein